MTATRGLVRDERGFSLAELLMVVAVLGLMMAGIVTLNQQGIQAYVTGSNRVEVQQNGRSSLELMVRELRSARSITTLGSATDMTFVNQNGQTIRYHLSGTTLNRVQSGVTRVLAGGVESLAMAYFSVFDVAGNTFTATAAPAQVRVIRIQMTTRTEETGSGNYSANQHAILQSTVALRSAL
jgi:prepilin-type N-terminal cleavage/methylation domain-containing protein